MKPKVTLEKELNDQVSEIRNNVSLFLQPYLQLDKRFTQNHLGSQVIGLCDYLLKVESKEELSFYADTIDRILTIINDYYLSFNMDEHKIKFLRLINKFQNDEVNYEIFKKKYFSHIHLFIVATEKIFNSSNKNLFFFNKIIELVGNLTQVYVAFEEIEKLNLENDKDKAVFLKGKLLAIPDFQVTQQKPITNPEETSSLAKCKKSISTFQAKRTPMLPTLDNTKEFCVTIASTALTVASSSSIGSQTVDLTTNLADLSVTSAKIAHKRTLNRAIDFACSATGVICLLLPFPGSQVIGVILLSKTLFDLFCNGINYVKKTIESVRVQQRTLERRKNVTTVFNSIFRNAKKSKAKVEVRTDPVGAP